MDTLIKIASDPLVMKWTGAVVLALLGFGFMRVRRHSVKDSVAFAAGILGMIIILSAIKYFFF